MSFIPQAIDKMERHFPNSELTMPPSNPSYQDIVENMAIEMFDKGILESYGSHKLYCYFIHETDGRCAEPAQGWNPNLSTKGHDWAESFSVFQNWYAFQEYIKIQPSYAKYLEDRVGMALEEWINKDINAFWLDKPALWGQSYSPTKGVGWGGGGDGSWFEDSYDTWYVFHNYIYLSKIYGQLAEPVRERFWRGIETLVEYSHNVNYRYPAFFRPSTLNVDERTRWDFGPDGKFPNEYDQAGRYAYLMLEAYQLRQDKRYLQEAEKALDVLAAAQPPEATKGEVGESWGSIAALELYDHSRKDKFLDYALELASKAVINYARCKKDENRSYDLRGEWDGFVGHSCSFQAPYYAPQLLSVSRYAPEFADTVGKLMEWHYINGKYWFYPYLDSADKHSPEDADSDWFPGDEGGHPGDPTIGYTGKSIFMLNLYIKLVQMTVPTTDPKVLCWNTDIWRIARRPNEDCYVLYNPYPVDKVVSLKIKDDWKEIVDLEKDLSIAIGPDGEATIKLSPESSTLLGVKLR